MTRRNKIIYWIATVWLALGMFSTGAVQLFKGKRDRVVWTRLPTWVIRNICSSILGIWKILGVVALLIPKFPLLKEWAYAGFFFANDRSHIFTYCNGIHEWHISCIAVVGPDLLILVFPAGRQKNHFS